MTRFPYMKTINSNHKNRPNVGKISYMTSMALKNISQNGSSLQLGGKIKKKTPPSTQKNLHSDNCFVGFRSPADFPKFIVKKCMVAQRSHEGLIAGPCTSLPTVFRLRPFYNHLFVEYCIDCNICISCIHQQLRVQIVQGKACIRIEIVLYKKHKIK